MKFGGAAVSRPEAFGDIAKIILDRQKQYDRVICVVSAMGDTTDALIRLAYQVNDNPPKREVDMLVTVGERVSASLLAMALQGKGSQAISFTGSQAGIITCETHSGAKIVDVRPHRLLPHLAEQKVVVVAGFQGVSTKGEITTLGRGGSDTTAVALGCAFGAAKVEFYKDVPGIYRHNPKDDPHQEPLARLDYEEALRIVCATGSEVLHPRCVELARKNALRLHVLSFKSYSEERGGTWIFSDVRPPESAVFE
jgi:aspartate kinase